METIGKFKLTADDVVAAARLFSRSGLTRPRTLVSWFVLWVLALVLVFQTDLVSSIFGLEPGPAYTAIAVACALLPFIAVVALVVILLPINARRIFHQQRSLQVDVAFGWSDEVLQVDSEYGVFAMPWSHFIRWVEDDRVFVIFESSRLYRMIPKRVLTEAQQTSLRKCLARIDERETLNNGSKQ